MFELVFPKLDYTQASDEWKEQLSRNAKKKIDKIDDEEE